PSSSPDPVSAVGSDPMSSPKKRNARRSRVLRLVAGLVLAVLVLAGGSALLPRLGFAWLSSSWPAGGAGEWIVYPLVPRTEARPAVELEAVFEGTLELPAEATRAVLAVRCLGSGTVEINGGQVVEIEAGDGGPGRRRRLSVPRWLRRGENRVVARVRNAHGPPALELELVVDTAAGRSVLASDEGWRASLAGAAWKPARRASRVVAADPLPLHGRRPWGLDAWRSAAPRLAVLALLALGAAWVYERWGRDWQPRWGSAETWLFGLVALLWLGLWLANAASFPLAVGFDARGHLDYVGYLLQHHALPHADQGWQMYQPPLYYLLAALLLGAGGLGSGGLGIGDPGAAWVLRGLGALAAVVQVGLLLLVLRRLFPDRPGLRLAGLVFAASLPLHLYLYQYASNEPLAATLATAVAWLMLRWLAAPSARGTLAVGGVLGLALLTKVTAAVLVPLVLGLVAWHRWRGKGGRAGAVRDVALAGGACAVVAGWFYARAWWLYGSPLVANWDPRLGFGWWQDPGYHTSADLLRWGRSLVEPWFAGFGGLADGVYSTLWGDGLAAGQAALRTAAPWDYPLAAVGVWLALGPMAVVAVGVWTGLRQVVREKGRRRDAVYLLGSGILVAAALVYLVLKVPSYAQSKAFYGQPALPALIVAFVWGVGRVSWRRRGLRLGATAYLLLWAAVSWSAVWVGSGEDRRLTAGRAFLVAGDLDRARASFERVLEQDPGSAEAHLGLFRVAMERGETAADQLDAAYAADPEQPEVLVALARREAAGGDLDGALERLAHALGLAVPRSPEALEARVLTAQLMASTGRLEAAVAELREALALDPTAPVLHRGLGELYRRLGDEPAARRHEDLLRRILARSSVPSTLRGE
ncbi:MAG: tetratricopeptide repeat protein, partial [Acidobacteria bacterium]|nr:tetratricopeptide repeat protein [Acidobacteriota bacterium]